MTRNVLKLAALVALACFVLWATGSPAVARGRACGNAFSGPDDPGFQIQVAGMPCSAAKYLTRRIIRAGTWGVACPRSSPCVLRGYTCYWIPNGDLKRQRCRRGNRRFSFGFGS